MTTIERHNPTEIALGMLGEGSRLLQVARRASSVGPVLGGVAVFLHGYRRTTEDIDLFADDAAKAAEALVSLGARWDPQRREHVLEGIPVHLVTAAETGDPPASSAEIDGVRVVALADLIRFKLRTGTRSVARSKDLADVVELIRRVPLDKSFAGRLPPDLRSDFKRLVDAVAQDGHRH
jgi:hypothetical protein